MSVIVESNSPSRETVWRERSEVAGGRFARAAKRSLDLAGAAFGLLFLAPLILLVAAMVKLQDPTGPVFYKQQRLGRGGKAIGVLKFRTMSWRYSTGPDRPFQTAQQAFQAMGREDLVAEFEAEQKVADDPRVSPVGKFLRKTSLDELPQFVNALTGDLSLVGPRPIIIDELARYGEHRRNLLSVKPGITGLWQVSGRSDTGYDERVQLDMHYIRNSSLRTDIAILFRTVLVVVAQRGAH